VSGNKPQAHARTDSSNDQVVRLLDRGKLPLIHSLPFTPDPSLFDVASGRLYCCLLRHISPVPIVIVLALFCLPLFVGLGRTDLQNDEAIYSFAVDRILETGDWLTPKISPSESVPFFEKPPLKFWIVAASIRLRLLPHNEFGLRFWDALFGSAAFLYVFLIGRRLAGPLCGVVAAGVLFVHAPLIFDHGLRSNNMEAALLLAYCGGMYHFVEWTRAPRRASAVAVALFFVLGFMTKFVAALFLPLVIALAVAVVPQWRRQVVRGWRDWGAATGVAVVLIVPWFVYEHVRFGSVFWHVLFGEHVFKRMTVSIDPSHVHPWNYYLVLLYHALRYSETLPLAVAGGVLLSIDAVRRRRGEGVLILLWFAAPMLLISCSPSKIYHYTYPFLPPLGIAAGLVPAWLWRTLQPHAGPTGDLVQRWLASRNARVTAFLRRPAVAYPLLAIPAAAIVLAALAAVGMPVRWTIGRTVVLRNAQVLRPWIVAFVLTAIVGRASYVARLLIPLIIVALMPFAAYRATLVRLPLEKHPQRDARDCVLGIIGADPPPGVHVQIMAGSFLHSYYYYFRRFGPWEWVDHPDDPVLYANLHGPAVHRPVLVSDQRYLDFRAHLRGADDAFLTALSQAAGVPRASVSRRAADMSDPMVSFGNVLLVLPGRYRACSADARAPAVR
jgi:4-amino-4-deoxy-L-arabinose transferase-like glycosyltransferase